VKNYGRWLVNQGYLQEDDIARIRKEARAELEHAESQILREPEPTGDRVLHHVIQLPQWRENTPRGAKRQSTMLSAINEGLVELAQRDPDFFVYGQDVGSPKGGVFGATAMLVTKFPERAISSPLNEQLIAGITAGAGMIEGKARCAEIQFVDYHQSAAQTLRLAARIQYQSYGDWSVPLLLRTIWKWGWWPHLKQFSRRGSIRSLERRGAVVYVDTRYDNSLPSHAFRCQRSSARSSASTVTRNVPGTRTALPLRTAKG